jgi:hypothetical protein
MPRIYKYSFTIECHGPGEPDLDRVEQLIDLSMQDLVYDEEFSSALDESEAITIQVMPILDK